jgi:cobalt-precorrin-7 (C5)-methyltransferase
MLYIIGVGPGDPKYLTLKAYEVIKSSDIVAGWESVLSRFKDLIKDKEIIKISYSNEIQILYYLIRKALNKKVAILNHGDPTVSDWQFIDKIRRMCDEMKVSYQIISGVSSINVAMAREGLDLAKVVFISHHVRGNINMDEIITYLNLGRIVILFPKPYTKAPQDVGNYLSSRGFNFKIKIYENLTLPNETMMEYSAEELAKENKEFSNLTLMIIYPKTIIESL